MTSRRLIQIVEQHGWYPIKGSGSSHRHFKHDERPGRVTIVHPRRDVPPGTVRSVLRQAGLDPKTR
jgi:predicted RNA binding protein YcfA (HicA-like mRNA interferase family)